MYVRACAVEIKPGTFRAAFRRAYGLTYKMATFMAAKGLFNTVYLRGFQTLCIIRNTKLQVWTQCGLFHSPFADFFTSFKKL